MAQASTSSSVTTADYVTDVTFPLWRKLVFSLTDLGSPMTIYYINAFLVTYFTGVARIPMASISLLMVVTRVFDAANDPIIGGLLDRTNWKNRYRPWAVGGAAATALSVIVLFAVDPAWAEHSKILWLWVFYTIHTIFSTVRNMAYKAFCGVVTSNGMERTKIGSIRGVMINIGSNLPGVVAIPLITYFSVSGGVLDRRGYLITLIILIAVGLPIAMLPPFMMKERIRKPPQQKISTKQQIDCLLRNPPMVFCLLGFLMFGLLIYGRISFLLYFFMYNAGNAAWYSTASVVQMIFGIVAGAFVPSLFRRTKNKGYVCALGLFLTAIGSFGIYFFHSQDLLIISVCLAVISLGTAFFTAMNMALVGDAADYAELKFGVRVDGFLNAAGSLMQKLGGAITPAIGTAVLGATGFVSGAPEQSEAVVKAISVNTWLVPAILALLSGTMFLFYKMNDGAHKEIVAQLEERRKRAYQTGETDAEEGGS